SAVTAAAAETAGAGREKTIAATASPPAKTTPKRFMADIILENGGGKWGRFCFLPRKTETSPFS
ncbi:MAG: hypothetical protein ACXWFO_03210, partial [Candidatus Aminicenantales bacterium]